MSSRAATSANRWEYAIKAPDPVASGQIVPTAAVERFRDVRRHSMREVVVLGGWSILWVPPTLKLAGRPHRPS